MSTQLPKPKYCGQNWSKMGKTTGGRICGACQKTIVDFSRMSWREIEHIQQENNNSVCGMYKQSQLDHWGQPAYPKGGCIKVTGASLLLSLTAASSVAQNFPATVSVQKADTLSPKTIIYGTLNGSDYNGEPDPLPGGTIRLAHTNIGTISDIDGKFELDLTEYADTLHDPELIFSSIGYKKSTWTYPGKLKGSITLNIQTIEDTANTTYFYVTKGSLKSRISGRLHRWFHWLFK